MKSLVVDFHGGCISVLSGMISASGRHEVDILAITDQAKILKANGYSDRILSSASRKRYLRRLGIWELPNLNQSRIRSSVKPINFILRWAKSRATTPEYDLAWVSFPPALYRRVADARLAKKVVVYVSHRADLWLARASQRRKFWARFTKDIASGRILAIASNEFDQKYVWFYTGLTIPLLKPVPHHVATGNALVGEQSFLLGPTNVNIENPVINELLVQVPNLFPIRTKYPNFTFDDISRHKGIVVLPYSIYSISLVEYEFLNMPIFVPSDRWLMEQGLLNDVRLFPLYGKRSKIQSLPVDRLETSPNSNDMSSWLEFAYWKRLENTIVWDSIQELKQLMATPASFEIDNSATMLAQNRQSAFNELISRLGGSQL